jgi:dTDP-4-dehydrorhamnose 3,5-epimerase
MKFNNYNPNYYENRELKVHKTEIPGLLLVDLVVNGDERGWFKETFQRQKLVELGFPADFEVIQNNASSNEQRGVTRGIHAEPWDKYISLTRGMAFSAIVDVRDGPTFGKVETFTLTPDKALFVPKGCGNSYQALSDNVDYTYLVNAHWSPEAKYTHTNVADPDLKIDWPIPLNQAIISDKDKAQPYFKDITPFGDNL